MELARRTFLKGIGSVGVFGILPADRVLRALAAGPRTGGYYLSASRLAIMQAMTYRFIPGPLDGPGPLNTPPDSDPGAREAQCYRYIDILLGAFTFDPPMIHAGGPFSNHHGSAVDDFQHFVPLDAHAELGWRIRIEGSLGMKDREFAGPVQGLQQSYNAGLDDIDARANSMYGSGFAALTGAPQDTILLQAAENPGDADNGFVTMAFGHTLEAMYGIPEYGGNQGLAGWANIGFDGDVQPQGYSDAQVSEPDAGAPPLTAAEARQVAAMAPLFRGVVTPRDRFWIGRRPFKRG